MDSKRAPWLEGYRVTIVDGHGLAAREPRIQGLREATGRAVPGKALGGYEPAQGLVTDVWPCEDGHAQERSPLGSVLHSVRKEDRWIADRHFCPRAFLREIDSRWSPLI